jgi:predicted nucleic acid-binding protein
MLEKLVDTNILIDRFLDPEVHKDVFLSEGLVYLPTVAYMELRAGAYTKEGDQSRF